jgi:hypothetical protein
MGDDRAIPALRRGADQAIDGRVKRACRAAVRRLEQRSERTAEVSKLSDAVESLRREVASLGDRLRKAEAVRGPGRKPVAPVKSAEKSAAKKASAKPPKRRPRRR